MVSKSKAVMARIMNAGKAVITRTVDASRSFGQRFYKQRYLMLMSLPFIVWCFIFSYLPMFGWIMAFQEFKLGRSLVDSFRTAEWVGLQHFQELFQDERFYYALRNTLGMSILGITIGFVLPIVFAIMINELRNGFFKRTVQTISYLPHFISWVIAAGMISQMLSANGPVNDILLSLGILDERVPFLGIGELFWGVITVSDIWKEVGWNAIVFLAAITSVDAALYEAAEVDGAGRFRRIWHITLPSIMNVIMVILIMNIGWLVNVGFERQMLLGSDQIRRWAEVLDVYVLRFGIGMGRYSYGTAIGIFRSVVSIILLYVANRLARRTSGGGII